MTNEGVQLPGFSKVKTPCQSVDPELFFNPSQTAQKQAKALCDVCPEKLRCLRQAEEEPMTVGTWGGKYFTLAEVHSDGKTCRKGLHMLPEDRENNICVQCRRDNAKRYAQTPKGKKVVAKKNAQNKARKRNKIGGTCYSGKHTLTEGNTQVRSYDGALMCTDCLQSLAKVRFKNDSGVRSGRVANTSQ